MKNNCQGFVMVEALIVTVFVVVIFTFMYTSVAPLLGKYESLENQTSIDSIYRIYAIRNEMYKNTNYFSNLSDNYGTYSLDNTLLNNIVKVKDYNVNNVVLFYVKNISSNKDSAVNYIVGNILKDEEKKEAQNLLVEYVKKYDDVPENVLFMYSEETKNGTVKPSVVHIGLAPDLTKPMVYHN